MTAKSSMVPFFFLSLPRLAELDWSQATRIPLLELWPVGFSGFSAATWSRAPSDHLGSCLIPLVPLLLTSLPPAVLSMAAGASLWNQKSEHASCVKTLKGLLFHSEQTPTPPIISGVILDLGLDPCHFLPSVPTHSAPASLAFFLLEPNMSPS